MDFDFAHIIFLIGIESQKYSGRGKIKRVGIGIKYFSIGTVNGSVKVAGSAKKGIVSIGFYPVIIGCLIDFITGP